ncbi:MAG TPA: ABC transporter permease [Acidimicrobiales bacterium]|nr:ABC transporter permease [Acidimicrobiales bacterium]
MSDSYLRRTVARLVRRPAAVVGLAVVAAFGLAGLLAPVISPYGLEEATSEFRAGPSQDHWLGTDMIGKDTFSQLLYGLRTSLWASLVAVTLAVVAGTAIGLCSGYFGGRTDQVLMRMVDAVLSFPGLLTAMVVVGLLGPSVLNAMIGLSVAFMPLFARLVRGQTLAVRQESYVEAALVVGSGPGRIIRRHVLPNVAPPLVVQASMTFGFALLAEGTLAFLGLSVQPPETSLGSLLRRGFGAVNDTPRLVLVPGLAITVLTLAFNAVADGLRDAMARGDADRVEGRL